ncbi:uncharacterized protein EV422DRAFT_296470 [Fimicolochytrium jonesii]|uniref:uncharacterized protein n=1 Tax=Fimicolochytrium jonesii TaxID=1396493 RepID=UPI0022FED52D|nr:uncharacterized protein EV422DRAFT_296470 [Fimicolochytrium jonesii]KAI8816320.1 hypothetical protein EV422DRAFT_296470 [Fimicolochytrium jonesii]
MGEERRPRERSDHDTSQTSILTICFALNLQLVEDLRREEANIVDQQAKANTAYHEACKMWGTSLVGNVEALVEHIVSARMAMFLKEHKAKEDTEVAEWRSEMTAEQARTWTQLSSMHARISHIEARPHDIPTRNTVTPLDLNERLAQYEKEQQTRRDNELVEVLASLKREFVDPLRVKVEKVEQTLAKPAVHVPPPAPAPAPPTSSSLLSSSRRAPTPPSRSNGISNRGLLPGAIPLPVGFPETRSTPRNSSPQNISSDTSHMESRLQHIQDLTNDMNAKLLDLQAQMEALKSKNSQVATNALPQEKVVEAINVLSERIIGLDQQLAGVKVVVDQVRTLPNKIEVRYCEFSPLPTRGFKYYSFPPSTRSASSPSKPTPPAPPSPKYKRTSSTCAHSPHPSSCPRPTNCGPPLHRLGVPLLRRRMGRLGGLCCRWMTSRRWGCPRICRRW